MSGPTKTLIAGFAAPAGNNYAFYDRAHYDDGSVYAPDLIEHDISAYGRNEAGFTIQRGVSSIVTTGFQAAAGTYNGVLENVDRRFDPLNAAGPYVSAGVTQVVPGVPIIMRVTADLVSDPILWVSGEPIEWVSGEPIEWVVPLAGANDYTLFTGTADDWPQQYPAAGRDQIIDLKATDDTQLFAGAQLDNFPRPAEYSGERIQAIIAEVGYKGPTAISHGNTIISALTNGSVSAWSHMTDVANAEWGDLYFSASGVLTFRSRDLILSETRSANSQATFGDQGTELRYKAESALTVDLPIYNDVTLTYSDQGAKVNAQNTASQRRPWRKRSLNVALPIHAAAVAGQYARWIVQRYAAQVTTFSQITLTPVRDPNNLYPQAFGRELGDRITVKHTPLGGGARMIRDCFIRGIRHVYANEQWATTFTLQDASWTQRLARYDLNTYDDGSVYSL